MRGKSAGLWPFLKSGSRTCDDERRTARRSRNGAPFDSVFAPPIQPEANARAAIPALIEGIISLPPVLSLRSKGALEGLYTREHLSAREIERLLGASHAGVLEALDRLAIPQDVNGRMRIGHLPFGLAYINHKVVKDSGEQAVIRMMQEYRAGGLSLRKIAGSLNLRLIPTKQNAAWQANTVRQILARA